MPEPRPEVMDFLRTRRSRPVRMLAPPAPDRAALMELLAAAVRVPDHGKLEPWRFVVLERPALERLAGLVEERGRETGREEADIAKQADQFRASPLAVALICRPRPHPRVPEVEQILSCGAVGLSLVNAALASGWGACWLTGWAAHDRELMARAIGLGEGEFVAGFIHIGTETRTPPERPRPDVAGLVSWADESPAGAGHAAAPRSPDAP